MGSPTGFDCRQAATKTCHQLLGYVLHHVPAVCCGPKDFASTIMLTHHVRTEQAEVHNHLPNRAAEQSCFPRRDGLAMAQLGLSQ